MYIGNQPLTQAQRYVKPHTVTATDTYNVNYSIGFLEVILNGSTLAPSEFTADDGLTVVLNSATKVGDSLVTVSWGTFAVGNIPAGTINVAHLSFPYAGKNLLINGDMSVSQRGNTTGGGFSLDRWANQSGTAIDSGRTSTTIPDGFDYSMYFTTSGSDNQILQPIELKRVGNKGELDGIHTLSFRLKAGNIGANITYSLHWADDSNYTNSVTIANKTIIQSSVADTGWHEYEVTVDLSSVALVTTSTCLLLAVGVSNATTSVSSFATGIQFEKGSEVTDFEYVDPALQLMRCSRYYAKGNVRGLVCTYTTANAFGPCAEWPVRMRAVPVVTAVISSYRWDGSTVTTADADGNSPTVDSAGMYVTNIVPTPTDNSNGYGTIHWTADAEL